MPLEQKYYLYGDDERLVLQDLIETLVVRFNEDCAHRLCEGASVVVHVFYAEQNDVFAVVASETFEPPKEIADFDFCASFATGVCEIVDCAPQGELIWLHAEVVGA